MIKHYIYNTHLYHRAMQLGLYRNTFINFKIQISTTIGFAGPGIRMGFQDHGKELP